MFEQWRILVRMEYLQKQIKNKTVPFGSVYVMTHSFFSDVIRIGFTFDDPQEYTKSLSAQTPGNYTLVFSQQCNNPFKVQQRIKEYLTAQSYVKEFYQVSAKVAERLLRREILIIPTLTRLS